MQTRGALGQQLLIPVVLHSFVVLMSLSYVRSVAFQVSTSPVRLILSVPFCGVWRLAKIYFCSVAGMIIRLAFLTIPFSVGIWSQKGQHGFKISSFNALSYASKPLCSLIFCNMLLLI